MGEAGSGGVGWGAGGGGLDQKRAELVLINFEGETLSNKKKKSDRSGKVKDEAPRKLYRRQGSRRSRGRKPLNRNASLQTTPKVRQGAQKRNVGKG